MSCLGVSDRALVALSASGGSKEAQEAGAEPLLGGAGPNRLLGLPSGRGGRAGVRSSG